MKQAYNLVWLSPSFCSEGQQTKAFVEPIPPHPFQCMLEAAERNPMSDVLLWIDSKRMTPDQLVWLKHKTAECPSGNFYIKDLRDIPRYNGEALFNRPDGNPSWRQQKQSLIWRQVDTVRVLVVQECLKNGGYDIAAYADADVVNLNLNGSKVKRALEHHGVMVANFPQAGTIEHHMFIFSSKQLPALDTLLENTFQWVYAKHQNGYRPFQDLIAPLIAEITDNKPAECKFNCRFDVRAQASDGQNSLHSELPLTLLNRPVNEVVLPVGRMRARNPTQQEGARE